MLEIERLDRCPICGGCELRNLLVAPDHESHTGDYGIDECRACGTAFTNPRPLEEELPKLYAERSTADFPRTDGMVQRLRDHAIDRYLAGQLGAIPAEDGGRLEALDYGCGDGALVRGLLRFGSKRGVSTHVTAVDFHEVAPPALSSSAGGIAYQSNAAWHAQPGRYDAIFLRHVLEHHPQPLRLLGRLAAALLPGGRLFVEVPNRRSVWARIFGRYYSGYYLPRHLFHFDRASLDGTLRKAGFREVDVSLSHTPLIGHSLGYLMRAEISNTGLPGLATYPVQVGVDVLCGRSTTLRAIAAGHG